MNVGHKNQHFVPQVYLRQFRLPGTERQIGVARINPFKFIRNGTIAGQCQEKYFYGIDRKAEILLQTVESQIGPAISNIRRLEVVSENDRAVLSLFIPTLYLRTRKHAEVYKLRQKYFLKKILEFGITSGQLRPPKDPRNLERWDFPKVPAFLLQGIVPLTYQMCTLGYKLLRANSGRIFITSDNPVVTMNEFACDGEMGRFNAGFGQSGFELVFPLSPQLCAFFYDAKVYKVGNRRDRIIQLNDIDTDIVNSLQIQSAEKCIYFSDLEKRSYLESIIFKYKGLARPLEDHLSVRRSSVSNEVSVTHHTSLVRLPATRWSFVRNLRNPSGSPGNQRNPGYTAAIEELMMDIEVNPGCGNLIERILRLSNVAADLRAS